MAIEIDYFAWEKWQPPKEFLGSLVHKNAQIFGFEGKDSFVQNGVLIASISYLLNTRSLPACYAFFAENETTSITKLLRYSWHHRKNLISAYYFDEIDIDTQTAQAFHQDFLELPPPLPAGLIDISSEGSYSYHIELGLLYEEKSYDWSSWHTFFRFVDTTNYKGFYTHVDRIVSRCEALIGHRHLKIEPIQQAIETYKIAFQSKAKYMKYQARWPKREKPLLESFQALAMSEWENLIDFKYYLPLFLTVMGFDSLSDPQFSSEHETILFTKLKEADLHTWDEDEQEAISAYFLALCQYSLSHYPSIRISTSSLMLWLMKLDLDLAPYLRYWETCFIYPDSLRHLGAFLKAIIADKQEDSLPTTLSNWFAQDNLEKALEDAVLAYENKRPYDHEFAEALEILRMIKSNGT